MGSEVCCRLEFECYPGGWCCCGVTCCYRCALGAAPSCISRPASTLHLLPCACEQRRAPCCAPHCSSMRHDCRLAAPRHCAVGDSTLHLPVTLAWQGYSVPALCRRCGQCGIREGAGDVLGRHSKAGKACTEEHSADSQGGTSSSTLPVGCSCSTGS